MIVSRKAGSVTLFSFDENEGLSEHTAPFDAIVTILDGECEAWVAGTTLRMKEGETIIFPANVPHALFRNHKIQDAARHDQGVKSMGGNDKDGYYCSLCGGIPPDKITTKRVLIDGKETGIDHLDWIFGEVSRRGWKPMLL